jgi:hypothetical protein
VLPLAALWVWLVFAGAAVALLWLRASGRVAAGAFAALGLALVALDLFRAGMGQNPAIPVEHARQPVTPAMERLLAARPARFAGLAPQLGLQALVPNLAMRYGLYDARGYDFPVEKRFDRLWRRAVAPGVLTITQPVEYATATPAAVRALSLLSVADLMQETGDKPLERPGLRLAYSGRDARVYANENALPRTFLVGGQRVVPGEDEALRAVTAPGFDGRRVAITESPVEGLPRRDSTRSPGRARLITYEPERVVAAATARRRALLVLTDLHFPGWKVRVDGRDSKLERVDYLLRGVALTRGRHRIEFLYQPASWDVARAVSLLGILALAAALAAGLAPHLRRRT